MNPKTNLTKDHYALDTENQTDNTRSNNVVPITTLEVTPEIRSLGQFLRSERERKRLSLEQIASATKISLKLLRALEDDRFELLPAAPFIRGFVSSYAKAVGVDPKETVARYQGFISERSESKQTRPKNVPHIFVNQDSTTDRSRTYLTIAMAAFGILGLFFAVFIKPAMKRHKHRADHVATQNSSGEASSEANVSSNSPASETKASDPTVATPVKQTPAPRTDGATQEAAVKPITTSGVKATESEVITGAAETTMGATLAKITATPKAITSTAAPTQPAAVTPPPSQASATTVKEVRQNAAPTKTPDAPALAASTPIITEAKKEVSSTEGTDAKKGNVIPPQDVKHKLVIRAIEDSWVKYQPDSRPVMGFTLKKDKMIYIRAKDSIRFTTGNPKGLEMSLNNAPFQPFHKGERSLVIPQEVSEKYKEKMFTE